MTLAFRTLPVLAALLVSIAMPAHGQDLGPRFGLGFTTLVTTTDGLGFGLNGRASNPLNADLSLAVDMEFAGFVLEGRRNATYVFTPQVSAIVTLPDRRDRAAYVLFGLGAHVLLGNDADKGGGPTLHAGIGWVRRLSETSLFYELDPALIIGEDNVNLAVPLRIGVIF